MESQLVAVELFGALGELPHLQIGQPQLCELDKGTGRVQDSPTVEAGTRQEPLLQPRACLLSRPSGDPHVAHPAVGVANPGLGDGAAPPTPHGNRAVGADGGSGPASHHRLPMACR